MFIRVGAQGSAVERIAGEFDRNSSNTGGSIVLHRRDGAMDGTCLGTRFGGNSVLRKRRGNCEQKHERDADHGSRKQGWDWAIDAAHAKTWNTFRSDYSGERVYSRRIFSSQFPTTQFLFVDFPTSSAAWRANRNSQRPNPRHRNSWSDPPRPDGELFELPTKLNRRRNAKDGLLMVPEGTPAIVKESLSVFRDGKCRSNERTY